MRRGAGEFWVGMTRGAKLLGERGSGELRGERALAGLTVFSSVFSSSVCSLG